MNLEYLTSNLHTMGDKEIRNLLSQMSLADLLDLWDYLEEDDMIKLFLLLDLSRKVDLIHELPTSQQEFIIQELSTAHIKRLLDEMEPDDITDFIQAVSPEVREAVWNSLSDEAKTETRLLLNYDEDDAAGLMTPRYLAIQSSLTIAQALRWLRKKVSDVETI
ncbi:MAG: hypothetical protein P8107_02115 [Spirochaetia bacterium]